MISVLVVLYLKGIYISMEYMHKLLFFARGALHGVYLYLRLREKDIQQIHICQVVSPFAFNFRNLEFMILLNKIQNLPNSVLVLLIFQKSEI